MPHSPHLPLSLFLAGILLFACDGGIDPYLLQRDASISPDRAVAPQCEQMAMLPTRIHREQAGAFTLVVPEQVKLSRVGITGAKTLESAVALERVSGSGDVSGFVISAGATKGEVRAQALDLVNRILEAGRPNKVFSSASLRHLGLIHKTHDGHPALSGTMIDLSKASEEKLSWIRNSVFPLILGGDLERFSGMPRQSQASGKDFVLVFSTILRQGRVIIAGGVVTLNDHDSSLSRASVRVADMANSSMLGPLNASPTGYCTTATAKIPPPVDLLWVIDGSVTMEDVRTNRLHKGVVSMWNEARDLGLDFRMAVLSMGRVQDGGKTLGMGLCNPTPYDVEPGRFWTSQDLQYFKSCVLDPAGNVAKDRIKGSYGLLNLREVMLTLLPRKAKDARRLRAQARTVVVFASDVEAGTVAQHFGGELPAYPFSDGVQAKLEDHLRPHVDLLLGKTNTRNKPYLPGGSAAADLTGSLAYALVADPAQGCSVQKRGTGYLEVVGALPGWADLICHGAKGTELLLEQLIRDVTARLAALPLAHQPISSTLVVAAGQSSLERSRLGGFDYNLRSNSLLLYNKSGSNGGQKGTLRVGYLRW